MKRLEKLIQKQEAIVNRTNVKSPFDAKVLTKLQALEKSGVNITPVGGEENVPKIECIVVNNLTKELMQTKEFPYVSSYSGLCDNPLASRGVRSGIELGTMLGRRLQIRSEIKTTKFTRLDRGKIDKRLISTLGYGAENLFYQAAVDKYKNVHLHISVDASSSMTNKWEKTMTTLVSIAKAASMINNVSVCISFRSGVHVSRGRSGEVPYVVIAYDSRKDKFSKITTLFPMLFPNGSTPEGLAFQAILDNIPESTYETDSYFVNLSDGEPAFNPGYFHETASRHTRKQVMKMVEKGVEVISYYVEQPNAALSVNVNNFKKMYGKDAQFIDTNNVVQIAHTLNKKFLSKAS
jgi:nitric oxide reductase activation protein